jgi:hypothetical protein
VDRNHQVCAPNSLSWHTLALCCCYSLIVTTGGMGTDVWNWKFALSVLFKMGRKWYCMSFAVDWKMWGLHATICDTGVPGPLRMHAKVRQGLTQ